MKPHSTPITAQDAASAAQSLDAIVEATGATRTAQGRRMHRALTAAAQALHDGRDPLDAIAGTYQDARSRTHD
jgi:hypothetical protein